MVGGGQAKTGLGYEMTIVQDGRVGQDLIGTRGRISTFGIFGFVVGPVIVALVLSVLEILHGDLAQTPRS